MSMETVNFLYLLELEINGSEAGHLNDALEEEEFPMRDVLGESELKSQIASGQLSFLAESTERFLWYREAVQCLSAFVSTYVRGIEVLERFDETGGRTSTKVLQYVGRRGEFIVVPLEYEIDDDGIISPGDVRLSYLQENWGELPRWAQDGYRLRFPELRAL